MSAGGLFVKGVRVWGRTVIVFSCRLNLIHSLHPPLTHPQYKQEDAEMWTLFPWDGVLPQAPGTPSAVIGTFSACCTGSITVSWTPTADGSAPRDTILGYHLFVQTGLDFSGSTPPQGEQRWAAPILTRSRSDPYLVRIRSCTF